MKFAREFRDALRREGFPSHWVDSAVPYGQLKKCLKKVQHELTDLGLDRETLRQLLAAHGTSAQGDSVPLARYNLDGAASDALRPRLTVFVHFKDGEAVNATLTPSSRRFLRRLSAGQLSCHAESGSVSSNHSDAASLNECGGGSLEAYSSGEGYVVDGVDRVEVPLVFDAEFFELLQSDVTSLDDLQSAEEASIAQEITQLGEDMAGVTKPSKFHKSDISRWREVFELYLDAQVFFSTHERDHGSRSSSDALQQLVWFQDEVLKRRLVGQFKLLASRAAFVRFVALNARLLQNLKFQEINRVAVTKILKKFDKRTSLGVSVAFPRAVHSRKFLTESVAKDLCAQFSQQVVSTVPRVQDYTCPVCLAISWLPVRLNCTHVFCVRCVVKMQREGKRMCPLCRQNVVLTADLRNLDHDLARFLELYFKKETKEKQKANDIERGIEMFGESYQHSSCAIM